MNELFNLEDFISPEEVMASLSSLDYKGPIVALYSVDPPKEEM